jgi:hypothetical protein
MAIRLTLQTGCSGNSDETRPKDAQKRGDNQKSLAELTAVVCTIKELTSNNPKTTRKHLLS